MTVVGDIKVLIDGEPWRPVATLADCGPGDRCFEVRIDPTGVSTVHFGDGVHGERPAAGAEVAATYRFGLGSTRDEPPAYEDAGVALVEMLAKLGDLLSRYQDAVAVEGYLDTATYRTLIPDQSALLHYLSEDRGDRVVCIRLSPATRASAS